MDTFSRILLIAVIFWASNLNAAAVGIGVKAGTLGYGADFSVALNDTVNARFSLTTLSIRNESEAIIIGDTIKGTLDIIADVDFGSSALLFDWHVFDGAFHLTAGLKKADIAVKFKGTLRDTFVVDGQTVSVNDINGQITGDILLSDSYEPYIGIGWGRKALFGSGLSFSAEIGIVYLDPVVSLNSTVNPAATSGITQAELDKRLNDAQRSADNELSNLDFWPVLSIGVNYAF